ncbi:unnamed protein product [Arctia plantaginis]|uniref:Uncharacterized protein n=1 Tax=Arctia plantaginis TaxID=874455 RepID=A0A8S0Z641_ARCPL|nr:unnamed protein product [Arctia plantaginis]
MLCYMALALPVTRDMQVSDVRVQSEVTTEIEPVWSLDLQDVLVRARRETVRGKGCPRGKVFFKRRCISYKKYRQLAEGDYEEK